MATLLQLVEALGPDLARVAVAPAGLAVPFREVVVQDPLDAPPSRPDALLLGVGLATDPPSLSRLLQSRPSALVVREGVLDDDVVSEAVRCGVVLLALPSGTSWALVTELARALLLQDEAPELQPATGLSELVPDLFEVANAVAELVGAPVTIEDNQSRLLAYSAQGQGADAARAATILGHRVPGAYREEVRRLGIAKRLLTETDPLYFAPDLPDIKPRVVVALRAAGQVVGSIWAVTDSAFDAERTAAFAQAAATVSLRIWQHRVTSDLRREQLARSLALVVAGGPAAVEVGRRIGLDAGGYRLLAATLRAGAPDRRELLHRVRDALSGQVAVTHPTALVAELHEVAYAVLPCSASVAASSAEARDVTARCHDALEPSLRQHVVVARSGHCASLSEMPQAQDEVQAVLRILSTEQPARFDAELEDVGLHVALHRLVDLQKGRPLLRNPVLEDIRAHDAHHGTDYLQTLEAHLAAFGDATVAAERLTVHVNTFRYRLRRLRELFDLDLDDSDVRFALMLELRLAGL